MKELIFLGAILAMVTTIGNADTKQDVAKEATKIRAEFVKSVKACGADEACKKQASTLYFIKRDANNAKLDK